MSDHNKACSPSFLRKRKAIHCAGFTLLEILIALFIFSIVSMILVGALHNVINNQAATEKKAQQFAKLQIALLLFSRDIEQATPRNITDSNGEKEGFLGSPSSIKFTHGGLTNPLGQLQRSTLQRANYYFSKHQLLRDTWQVLDQTPKTKPDTRPLLKGVQSLEFSYLDDHGRFQRFWPPSGTQKTSLPQAVRITFTLDSFGSITQLYLIQGSALAPSH